MWCPYLARRKGQQDPNKECCQSDQKGSLCHRVFPSTKHKEENQVTLNPAIGPTSVDC